MNSRVDLQHKRQKSPLPPTTPKYDCACDLFPTWRSWWLRPGLAHWDPGPPLPPLRLPLPQSERGERGGGGEGREVREGEEGRGGR